jgi:hypothetical protein
VLRVICFEPVFLAFIREAARKAIPDKGFLLAYFLASVQKSWSFWGISHFNLNSGFF